MLRLIKMKRKLGNIRFGNLRNRLSNYLFHQITNIIPVLINLSYQPNVHREYQKGHKLLQRLIEMRLNEILKSKLSDLRNLLL